MHEFIQSVVDVLIVVMGSILILFTLALFFLHILTTSNNKRVEQIKKRILRMLSAAQGLEYLRGRIYELLDPNGQVHTLREIRGIRSNLGTIALTVVVEEVDREKKDRLRGIIERDDWYTAHMHAKMRSRNEDAVGVFTKLIADLQVSGFEEDVYANLYHKKTRVETQEISLLALFACGCRDKLIHVFSDPNFNLVLSFRPVQELFMHYTGDHQDLYGELLEHYCDGYVLRSCIHGIGAEGFEKLCPLVMPYLDSDNMNLVTESIRTLGRLHYGPALEKIRAYTSHETWWIRSAAVTALAGISPDTCFSDLMRCLCDKEWWVRLHAAEALNSLPGHPDLLEEVAALEDRFAYDMMSYIRERGRILEEKVAV